MKPQQLITAVLGAILCLYFFATPINAETETNILQYNYSVPDVIDAFDALTHQGEWLGFHMSDSFGIDFTKNESRHIQGFARAPRGLPTFFITHSTDLDDTETEYAGIMVAQFDTRPQNGERLRSNRLLTDTETTYTVPPVQDRLINSVEDHVSHHPSGIGMVGEILAVPTGGKILFYNSRDFYPNNAGNMPEEPTPIYAMTYNKGSDECGKPDSEGDEPTQEEIDAWYFSLEPSLQKVCHGVQAAGITRTPNGRFLLVTNDNVGAMFHWSDSVEDLIDRNGGPTQHLTNQDCMEGLFDTCEYICKFNPGCVDELQKDPFCENDCQDQDCIDNCPIDLESIFDCSYDQNCIDNCHYDQDCINNCPNVGCIDKCQIELESIIDCSYDQDCIDNCEKSQDCIDNCHYDQDCIDNCPEEPSCDDDCHTCEKACAKARSGNCRGQCPGEFCSQSYNENFFSGFQYVWREDIEEGYWPIKGPDYSTKAHQSVSLVDQIDENGKYRLFLIGSTNSQEWSSKVPGNNELYLLEVVQYNYSKEEYVQIDLAEVSAGNAELQLKGIQKEKVKILANPGSWDTFGDYFDYYAKRQNGNFNAAGGAYVSPSGELIYYGVSLWNDGPGDTVKIAELRHMDVVHEGSENYTTQADPGGPYTVSEGSSLQLNGRNSHPPIVEPWVLLSEDLDSKGYSVMVDYDDYNRDDYDDFSKLDEQPWFCGDDWCLDPETVSELTTLLNAFKEDNIDEIKKTFKDITIDDFLEDICYGSVFKDDTCWILEPPVSVEACQTGCDTTFNHAEDVCQLWTGKCCRRIVGIRVCIPGCNACVSAAKAIRDDLCKPACSLVASGLEGIIAPYPDFDGIGTKLETIVSEIMEMLTASVNIFESIRDNIEAVDPDSRFLDKLDRLESLLPSEPDFSFTKDSFWVDPYADWSLPEVPELTTREDVDDYIVDLATFVGELAQGVEEYAEGRLTAAFNELTSYLTEYASNWEDFLLSLEGFNDQATSLRWYAPVGTNITLYSKNNLKGDTLILEGTGQVQWMSNIGDEWNDRVRSLEFDSTFSQQYLTGYLWSIPFQGTGLSFLDPLSIAPTISAEYGDGPAEAVVQLSVTSSGGESAQASTTLQVENVPPTVTVDSITQPGLDPTYLLPFAETEFVGSFTDPGLLDTHTGLWDLGDGSGWQSGVIVEENDAPDSTGSVTGSYAYSYPGTYTVWLKVTDDDGGEGADSQTVKVLTSQEAAQMISEHIQNCSDDLFKKNPSQLRNALLEKFDELIEFLNAEEYENAMDKLVHDIRFKTCGLKNSWIIDEDTQEEICPMIDALAAYLQQLI